jgi:ELWxxDGT repeat protein
MGAVAPAYAAVPYRVADLISSATFSDSGPAGNVDVGGATLFMTSTDGGDVVLWRTDGTDGGTTQVRTFVRPADDGTFYISTFGQFRRTNDGRAVFGAWDATNGNQVWITDGTTAGTKVLTTNAFSGAMYQLTVAGTKVYYVAGQQNRTTLWAVDLATGTAGLVLDMNPQGDRTISIFTVSGNDVLVNGWNGTASAFYMVRGSVVTKFGPTGAVVALRSGDRIYLVTTTYSADYHAVTALWRSDGTDAGTTLLHDRFTQGGSMRLLADGRLLMSAADDTHGQEFWISDGTVEGTKLLFDLNPGLGSSQAITSSGLNGDIYIFANDGRVPQFYRFTPSTNTLTTVRSGIQFEGAIGEFGGYWYFLSSDQEHGQALWRTDGSSEGTAMFLDISPKLDNSELVPMFPGSSRMLFNADDGSHGSEPWISDGTVAGTHLLHDCNTSRSNDSNPSLVGTAGNSVFFTAVGRTDVSGGGIRDLWKSNGTVSNATMVAPLDNEAIDSFLSSGSHVFYVRRGITSQLYSVDENVPVALANMPVEAARIVAFGSGVAFVGAPSQTQRALDVTDGTAAGTTAVTTAGISPVGPLAATPGHVYFFTKAASGATLWRSNGTAAGTATVTTLAGLDPVALGPITTIGERVFFYSSASRQLWCSDGTESGTTVVATLAGISNLWNVAGSLFALAGNNLWKSDGGDATPMLVSSRIASPAPVAGASVTFAGVLYWYTSESGFSQLWRSDGTTMGTYPIVHFLSPNTIPARLGYANNQLFFAGYDKSNSYQMWTSNGLRSGTHALVAQPYYTTPPQGFLTAGSKVFFPGTFDYAGEELWAYDASATVATPTPPTVTVTLSSSSAAGLTVQGTATAGSSRVSVSTMNYAAGGATIGHHSCLGSSSWVVTTSDSTSTVLPVPLNAGTTDIYLTAIDSAGVSNEITLTVLSQMDQPVPAAPPVRRRAAH